MNTVKPGATDQTAKDLVCRPQKILVPQDFSDNAKQALPYALQFAQQFGARLYLVHVLEPNPVLPDLRDMPLALSEKEIATRARADLEVLAQEAFKGLVPVELVVRKGKPFEQIIGLADELKMDLIVIATHGYTGLKHTLLGSTTERVVRHASCPVLVVRQPEEPL